MEDRQKELEACYGPSSPYSEHIPGDHICYIDEDGNLQFGIMRYVCSCGSFGEHALSVLYIVQPLVPKAIEDIVKPANILQKSSPIKKRRAE
jgi:hypothetical protein